MAEFEGLQARTALPSAATQGNQVDASADKFGRQLIVVAPLDQCVTGLLNRVDNAAADVIAAPGANVAIVVQTILITNAHATVSTKVSIRDGTTVKVTGYSRATGAPIILHNEKGLFVASANTAVTAICATTGSDIDIFVAGYKVPA
jgi:hypothetical protein